MAVELRPLYELQQIDTQLARVEKARAALDDGASLRAETERCHAAAQAQKKKMHDLEIEYNDQDLKLKGFEAKRQQHRDKLFSGTLSNPKELESLRKEIEALTRSKGAFEEKLLVLMDEIESQKQTLATLETEAHTRQEQLDAHQTDYAERMQRMRVQLEDLRAQRAQAVTAVNADLLELYTRLLKKTNQLAIVKVAGSNCTGCGVQLTSFAFRKVRDGDSEVRCENCDRMLYYEDEG